LEWEKRIVTYQNTVLIYNPVAGRLRGAGLRKIERAVAALEQRGMRVRTVATSKAGEATGLARRAVSEGADLILTAGGDGTINEAANGVIGSAVPFGILPGGTANVLAMELGFGANMDKAVHALAACSPQRIAVGRLTNDLGSRYFLMMAGAGLDAEIVYRISARLKESWGKLAYWIATSARLTRSLPELSARVSGGDVRCGFALASRVKNYGGDLSIATGASLIEDDFEVVLFRGRHPLRYAAYFLGVATGTLSRFRGVTVMRSRRVELSAPEDRRIYAQVDGEFAGHLPAIIEIVPDALSLMVPADFHKRLALRAGGALMPAAR
jgi:diacylglycerol kinase (ATP)